MSTDNPKEGTPMRSPRTPLRSLLHRLATRLSCIAWLEQPRPFFLTPVKQLWSLFFTSVKPRLFLAPALVLASLAFTSAPAFAKGDANNETCPPETEASPGFRSYLPDCRAYEQVTPVYKNGSQLGLAAISVDGSSLLGVTLNGFAETESDSDSSEGSVYRFARSALGWAVSAISPPSSLFPANKYVTATPDLSRTLWVARTPSESVNSPNIYIRESDGAMVKVGPLVPPTAAAGPPGGEFQVFPDYGEDATEVLDASSDLSHVAFQANLGRRRGLDWPGDPTIGSYLTEDSLYQYSSAGQPRPELVGVSDGSTIVPGENEGKALPAGRLISACNTYLGSPRNHELYNAQSADGATVFFTAMPGGCTVAQGEPDEGLEGEGPEVNELYARVDGLQTVPISEPAIGTSGACSVCLEGTRQSAEFAGASEDGSKVFFLTGQELLPGAEGTNLFEYDFDAPAGARVIQASAGLTPADVLGVARVSEDGSHVYFVAEGALTAGANREGKEPVSGQPNLYVFERDASYPAGRLSFIATLSPGDREDWRGEDIRRVQATPDGRFLVFDSEADLTAGDTSTGLQQVFEYDAATGELVRVSREQTGYTAAPELSANQNRSEIPSQSYYKKAFPTTPAKELAVSADGATVVFGSKAALTEQSLTAAEAHVENVYEYRSSVGGGGSISDGNVYLISDGVPSVANKLDGLDASGQDVFFLSANRLVPQDTDTQFDVYDARVDGGFPAPDPPAGCLAYACAGTLYSAPSLAQPAGAAAAGTAALSSPTPLLAPAQAPKGDPGTLSRARRLTRALRACARRPRSRRGRCERAAIARYGPLRPKPSGTRRTPASSGGTGR
jgi:hypothetical protein